jgi:hypothetical protein
MIRLTGRNLLFIDRLFWTPHRLLEKFTGYGSKKKHDSGNILVIKFMGLGSLVLFARLCEQSHVDKNQITLLTFARHAEFCKLFGFPSHLLIRTSTLPLFIFDCFNVFKKIRTINPSFILDYERCSYAVGTLSQFIALLCNAKTISFQKNREKNVRHQIIHDANRLTYHQILLTGISIMPKRNESQTNNYELVPTDKILVNINASDYLLARRYPLASFAEVLKSLHQWNNHLKFYFTGTQSEKKYIDDLIRQIPECNATNTAGEWSLGQLRKEIAHCRLLITCDSAPLHIAAYFETPTIVIWGPTQPSHFGYEHQKSLHHISNRLSCSPCFTNPRSQTAIHCKGRIDCLKALSPKLIEQATISLLNTSSKTRFTPEYNKILPLEDHPNTQLAITSETI